LAWAGEEIEEKSHCGQITAMKPPTHEKVGERFGHLPRCSSAELGADGANHFLVR